ncbi:glycosyl transferase family 2 [Photorhabdus luminescens]|nr:glycosyl transferase family 2 [Photorhabdus luminescens]
MPNLQPLVSVILPVYNGERFIASAVESILNQTYHNLELIVINDGSEDRTDSIIQPYLKDSRLNYISRENKGLVATLNEALEKASGIYIARMDADDIAMSERIALQVEYLLQHPHTGLIGSNITLINELGEIIGQRHLPHGENKVLSYFLYGNPIAHPSVMLNRAILKNELYYDKNAFPAEDLELWLRIIKIAPINNLNKNLLFYRITNSSITSNNSIEQKIKDYNLRLDFFSNISQVYSEFVRLIKLKGWNLIPLFWLIIKYNISPNDIIIEHLFIKKKNINILLLRTILNKFRKKIR